MITAWSVISGIFPFRPKKIGGSRCSIHIQRVMTQVQPFDSWPGRHQIIRAYGSYKWSTGGNQWLKRIGITLGVQVETIHPTDVARPNNEKTADAVRSDRGLHL